MDTNIEQLPSINGVRHYFTQSKEDAKNFTKLFNLGKLNYDRQTRGYHLYV